MDDGDVVSVGGVKMSTVIDTNRGIQPGFSSEVRAGSARRKQAFERITGKAGMAYEPKNIFEEIIKKRQFR